MRLGGPNGVSLFGGFDRFSDPRIPFRRTARRLCRRRHRLSARRSPHLGENRIDGGLKVAGYGVALSHRCGDLGQHRTQRRFKVDRRRLSTLLGLALGAGRANGLHRLPPGSRLQLERPRLVESRNAFAQFLQPRPRAVVEHDEKICVKAWRLQCPNPSFDKLLRVCVFLRRFQQLLEVVEHEQNARASVLLTKSPQALGPRRFSCIDVRGLNTSIPLRFVE